MKKSLLTLASLIFAFSAFSNDLSSPQEVAQDGDTDFFIYQEKSIRYGFFLAPSLDWANTYERRNKAINYKTESMGANMGFKIGATVDYGVKNGINFSSGIHYNYTFGELFTRRISGNDLLPSQVNVADMSYKVGFLEVPITIRYTTPDLFEHFRIYSSLGLGASLVLHKQAAMNLNYVDHRGVPESYHQDYENLKGWLSIAPISLYGDAAIGVQYDVDYKRTVYLGVSYQNKFIPDMTANNRMGFPVGDLTFNDGHVTWNHVALRLGILF